jgi:TRAP-type mannitol/chloroaromatic compound transport system permease small subunit
MLAKVGRWLRFFYYFRYVVIIDKLVKYVGTFVSWLTLLLVIVIVVDVALRYLFNTTSAASFELEWHLFAAIFLLGAAYTLQQDKHVRVDVFYHRFSEKTKAWINLIGTLLLLLPFCVVAFWESISFVQSSFAVNETSPDPGGLPARYLIKSAIPIGFLLLGLQGINLLLKSASDLLKNDR